MTNPNKVVDKLLEAEDLDWEPDPEDPDDHMPEIIDRDWLMNALLALGFQIDPRATWDYVKELPGKPGSFWQIHVFSVFHDITYWFVNLSYQTSRRNKQFKRWSFEPLEIYRIPRLVKELTKVCPGKQPSLELLKDLSY